MRMMRYVRCFANATSRQDMPGRFIRDLICSVLSMEYALPTELLDRRQECVATSERSHASPVLYHGEITILE